MLPDNDVCTRIEHLVNLTLIVIDEQGLQAGPCRPCILQSDQGRSNANVNISGVSHSRGRASPGPVRQKWRLGKCQPQPRPAETEQGLGAESGYILLQWPPSLTCGAWALSSSTWTHPLRLGKGLGMTNCNMLIMWHRWVRGLGRTRVIMSRHERPLPPSECDILDGYGHFCQNQEAKWKFRYVHLLLIVLRTPVFVNSFLCEQSEARLVTNIGSHVCPSPSFMWCFVCRQGVAKICTQQILDVQHAKWFVPSNKHDICNVMKWARGLTEWGPSASWCPGLSVVQDLMP